LKNMRNNVIKWIEECHIIINHGEKPPMWKDEIEYHLYHLEPLVSLSEDTLGPLPEDENEFSFIVVIVDNFCKFVGLYPGVITMVKDLITNGWYFWGIKEISSDSRTQFTSKSSSSIVTIQASSCSAISTKSECSGRETHGRGHETPTSLCCLQE